MDNIKEKTENTTMGSPPAWELAGPEPLLDCIATDPENGAKNRA